MCLSTRMWCKSSSGSKSTKCKRRSTQASHDTLFPGGFRDCRIFCYRFICWFWR
ncbi:hypothetical protein OESDEN_25543 [Oesophagostomum dentatum]|uniref:Uncharacterized protein n=1 Tax=Oesophagostomum dentatum TaxID=61180 RepID=A0A0B1RT72_OESDE|nr:hypothetical protein OESDEN_25543 [Oesophagostomum dentatum]